MTTNDIMSRIIVMVVVSFLYYMFTIFKYFHFTITILPQTFDRVWHEGLQFKLKQFLPSSLFLLIKSYLTDRHYQVQCNSSTTGIAPIKADVSQDGIFPPFSLTST